ncbi:hypothetical protein R3W88_007725 [Solanum pinnatisectum]|uniref:DUF4283 domain-containing protein n=1 Tax=Solanum pinnatisectum TaxID=50273 RepID=A0AAV9M6I4_9SOLN|nr:hypothetical protein R3W88_007725 [Solanum pinnatisectum]
MDDIRDDVEYWNTAVICYVLGSNHPQSIMEGYFNRIWKGMGIDKICPKSRSKVVESGIQMFDRKPIVVKPWRPEIELNKEIIEKMPIWIRLVGLDIKYWGKNALTKIAGLVGNPLKEDTTTKNKVRLTYARVLVEMSLNKEYPTGIMFENEIGIIVEQKVEYEWKPVWCNKCKNYGHELKECWRQQKEVVAAHNKGNVDNGQHRGKQIQEDPQVDKTGNGQEDRVEPFQKVTSPGRRILHTPGTTILTGNNYEVLNKEQGEQNQQERRVEGNRMRSTKDGQKREGELPTPNG